MNLVPTLEKLCFTDVASDFWKNHAECQTSLDAQCAAGDWPGVYIVWDPATGEHSVTELPK